MPKNPYSQEIHGLEFLEKCFWKQYLLVPILSVASFLMLPLVLYWYPKTYI